MIKIESYYNELNELNEAEEPFRSVATMIDRMGANKEKDLEPLSMEFSPTLAVNCIKTIAERLTQNKVSFVRQIRSLWHDLCNIRSMSANKCESYAVSHVRYLGVIFGGVYFVLAYQKSVDEELLALLDSIVSEHSGALPYYNKMKSGSQHEATTTTVDAELSTKRGERFTTAQTMLFCEAFLRFNNCHIANKKETIPPIASRMFGWRLGSLERNTYSYSKEDKKVVAELFRKAHPDFADFVENMDNKYQ